MIEFIVHNLGTILVGLIVLAIVVAIVVKQIKNHKAGKSSCGCGCENCPSASMCHHK